MNTNIHIRSMKYEYFSAIKEREVLKLAVQLIEIEKNFTKYKSLRLKRQTSYVLSNIGVLSEIFILYV